MYVLMFVDVSYICSLLVNSIWDTTFDFINALVNVEIDIN